MALQSIHYGLCQYVQERIRDVRLAIEGVEPDLRTLPPHQVYLRRLPTERDCEFPCVILCPWAFEGIEDESFEDQNCTFQVLVWIVFANNQDYALAENELLWRQQIVDAFDGEPLVALIDPASTLVDDLKSLANVSGCTIEPVSILDADAWQNANLALSGMVLRFDTNRPRSGRG
jgi:hypothetical protein